MKRTRIQVSNLATHHDKHVPYCHWTFPDDEFGNNEPSYMMGRKLKRRTGRSVKLNPFESSLHTTITKYVPMNEDFHDSASSTYLGKVVPSSQEKEKILKRAKLYPNQPVLPKRPKTSFILFLDEEREKLKSKNVKMSTILFTKAASTKWKQMALTDKIKYDEKSKIAKAQYQEMVSIYKKKTEEFRSLDFKLGNSDATKKSKDRQDFFDKVIKLNSEGQKQAGKEFKYYYVLTFIPDLFWCHLAPLKSNGLFGESRPQSKGRPIWILVDENECKELDISASFCKIVESTATLGCCDADKEQWDISETITSTNSQGNRCVTFGCNGQQSTRVGMEASTAIAANKNNDRQTKDEETGGSQYISGLVSDSRGTVTICRDEKLSKLNYSSIKEIVKGGIKRKRCRSRKSTILNSVQQESEDLSFRYDIRSKDIGRQRCPRKNRGSLLNKLVQPQKILPDSFKKGSREEETGRQLLRTDGESICSVMFSKNLPQQVGHLQKHVSMDITELSSDNFSRPSHRREKIYFHTDSSPQIYRKVGDGKEDVNLSSSHLSICSKENDESSREIKHLENTVEINSLNGSLKCVLEDSKTLSDAFCDQPVKEFITKIHTVINDGKCSSSRIPSKPKVRQKQITSYFSRNKT